MARTVARTASRGSHALHPLAQQALRLLEGGGAATYGLDARGRLTLERALAAITDRNELRRATRALVELAYFLATCKGADDAASDLVRLSDAAARRRRR